VKELGKYSRFQIPDCIFQIADSKFQIADSKLQMRIQSSRLGTTDSENLT
jgi:hypothetical protein